METITRRQLIQMFCTLPLAAYLPRIGNAQEMPDFSQLKVGYAQRLKRLLAAGELPYFDIESSCDSSRVDMNAIARSMDQFHIGLMALSADIGKGQFRKGVRFDNLSNRLLTSYPDRFVPVGNGGQPPALTEAPDEFLDAQETAARMKQIMLFGEFEFRHYPSPRQVKQGDRDRDVHVPIDGPTGHRLFGLSEQTGLPFQLHYEIEDELLPPLEKMLEKYSNAKVIWCHLAQIRYMERTTRYTAHYVDALIKRFPNLYFDTAFGDATSVYPLSNQRHARLWGTFGGLKSEWRDLIAAYPKRFLSALDLGQDRLDRIAAYDQNHRNFLSRLPKETQHQVAYRSAWSLLFGEEFA
jgi:hypothetical protein